MLRKWKTRTRKVAVVITLACAAVGFTAGIASAHQNQITGRAVCNEQTGQYDVTWYNHGDAAHFGNSVIIESSRASVATGQTIPAEQTVQVGTESVPGDTTGPLMLSERWFWPKDNFKNRNTGSVKLEGTCVKPDVVAPKAFADCDHIWLNNSESNVEVTFDVNGTKYDVAAGETKVLPSPGDKAHVVITVGETVLFDKVLSCSHTTPPPSHTTPPPSPPGATHSATHSTSVSPLPGTADTGLPPTAAGALIGLAIALVLGFGMRYIGRKPKTI